MEQIAKLLFATTFVSIFCYLVMYFMLDSSGNGGEYWGYDGHVEPFIAAGRTFEAGDYRFLGFELENSMGSKIKDIPIISGCDNHPFGSENFYRMNTIDAKHGADSIRKAESFSRGFNETMASYLYTERRFRCAIYVYE